MIVNGKQVEIENSISVKKLLARMNVNEDVVVVEVDCEIVSKSTYESVILDDASRVEIVAFVGGG